MFIPRLELEGTKVGTKVVLTRDVEVLSGKFTAGHEMTIVGSHERGYDLVDKDGNQLGEIHSSLFGGHLPFRPV